MTDVITGQTQEDIERTMRDGFIAVRDDSGHLLMRYHPAKNLIEVKRRGQTVVIDLGEYRDIERLKESKVLADNQVIFWQMIIDHHKESAMSAEEELKQLKVALMKRFTRSGSPVTLEDMTLDFCINLMDDVSMNYVRLKSATSAAIQGGANGRQPHD